MTPVPTNTDATDLWRRTLRIATLLAVAPHELGGVVLRAPYGPMRDAWLATFAAALPRGTDIRRMPATIDEAQVLGGLDLSATLAQGKPAMTRGLLASADGGVIAVPMAERLSPSIAAHLAGALDEGLVRAEREGMSIEAAARFGLVLLDEGEDGEAPPAALVDRLAFAIDLRPVPVRDASAAAMECDAIAGARKSWRYVEISDDAVSALAATALALGIDSARAGILSMRTAKIIAALDDREMVDEDDIREAAALVLAPRATRIPAPAADEADDTPPPDTPPEQTSSEDVRPLDDIVLEAAKAALPPGLLALLAAQVTQSGRAVGASGKAGALRSGLRRGRAIGARPGLPGHGARLDVIATLRAAAPLQRLRTPRPDAGNRIAVRRDDFRITKFKQHRATTTIFLVDASGSTALQRLGEAKGAVRLMLADCYIRRDQVALIAFRGKLAELLLPPTRALARADRALAGLPSGGGTPVAAGLDAATQLAEAEHRQGRTPNLVMLTDGRANVARDGAGGRAKAQDDARHAASVWRMRGFRALVIDTSATAHPLAGDLAREMGARFLFLPHADARAVNNVVRSMQAGP